ncbi:MAG: hypothetical protein H7Y38_20505, partial [Armatimonadetes bacterium]|nr:hypothetical protein [Armatimonadota bacterium]
MNEADTDAATTEAIAETETVMCRPKPMVFWGGVIVLFCAAGFYGLYLLTTRSGSSTPMTGGFLVLGAAELLFFVAGGVFSLLHALRTRVVADEAGVRWRGITHGWRTATWAQVSDYYTQKRPVSVLQHTVQTASAPRPSAPAAILQTPSGMVEVAADLTGFDDFSRIVRERATAARVDAWQAFGTRRVDDFPQTFRYWNPGDDKRFVWKVVARVLISTAIAVGFWWLAGFIAQNPFLEGSDKRIVHGVLLCGFAAFLAFPVSDIRAYIKAWKRRGESISVTPETVRHENAQTGVVRETAWRDVSDYFYRATKGGTISRYTLVLPGADEPEISWDVTLQDAAHLLALVQTFAPAPGTATGGADAWRNKSLHEKTGGSDPATWQGGAVGMGGRVFRLRSAETMVLLGIFTVTALIVTVLCIVEGLPPGVNNGRIVSLGITSAFVLPTVWGWVCYAFSRVETDDMGITQYTPFGKKYLPWFAVADYRAWGSKSDLTSGGITVAGQNGVRL